ncbi:MAG: hypothetical protein NC184_04985 [Roseburia sp.]|nr:hypothetical protein [Roseburia sp.]
MAKNGTCELCGLPDNSYSIEEGGTVLKVCKLCYDGFIEKHGSDSVEPVDSDVEALAEQMSGTPEASSKPETLSPDQMAKLLTPTSEERRKINASLKKAAAQKVAQDLASDTEDLKRELLQTKEEIRNEELAQAAKAEKAEKIEKTEDNGKEKGMNKSPSEAEQEQIDRDIKAARAEEKRAAALEKLKSAANPTIDDERIKITSPEVELPKDTRPKTNFDVATKEHVSSVRFIEAFKYVMHPVSYAVLAGAIVLAVATALMITMSWKEAVIDFFAGCGAVGIGLLLVWYLKRRLEVDRRTFLLRIRQEQIAFNSIVTPCYRELKTKYPIIKALAWLLSKLSVILPVIVIIGGSIASVVLSFLSYWWLLAPVMVGAVIGAVLLYYILKFSADWFSYKLDIERNQQIVQQSLLDILAKKK